MNTSTQEIATALTKGIKHYFNDEDHIDKVNELSDLFQEMAQTLSRSREFPVLRSVELLVSLGSHLEDIGTAELG